MRRPADSMIPPASFDAPSNDERVLEAFAEEEAAVLTFQGLRRRSGLHQESLARALRRLEEEGRIERTPEGYRLVSRTLPARRSSALQAAVTLPLLQAHLPPQLPPQQLLEALQARWSRHLRWMGYATTSHGLLLKWTTATGGEELIARIVPGMVRIETPQRSGLRLSEELLMAAYELFEGIAEAVGERLTPAASRGSEPLALVIEPSARLMG